MNYKSHSPSQVSLVFSIKFWILTIILVLFYSLMVFAQYNTTFYFDPSNSGDPDQDGSIQHPFDLLSDINIESNTECLIKRGTQMEINSTTSISNRSFVRIATYGTGEKPIIKVVSANTKAFHIRYGSDNVIIDSLKIEGMTHQSGSGSTLIYVDAGIGSQNVEDVSIYNCELYNGTKGIESVAIGSLSVERLSIVNCEIHDIGLDGISARTTNDLLIKGCHIYDVNMFWHTNGHLLSESYGNGIQVTQGSYNWKIYDNTIDRRNTGNKFCFIFAGSDEYPGVRGEIIGNTFFPAKDTIDDQGGSVLFISPNGSQYVKIERNYFCGRSDNRGNKYFEGIGTIAADTTLFNYNVADSITKEGSIQGSPDYCEVAYVNNNTIVGGSAFAMYLFGVFPNNYAEVKNNLTAGNTDDTPIYIADVPNSDVENNLQLQTINTSLYNTALSIVNWETSDYRRTEDINDGMDVGLQFDFDSTLVSNPPEVGAYEYIEGSITNTSPQIEVQGFYVLENVSIGEEVGIVEASDPDIGQELTYSIILGNTDNTFQIDPVTGTLTVSNNETLDFETNPGYALTVQVQDNGPGSLISQATITVGLIDLNEAPIVKDQAISVEENSQNNQEIGYVNAIDPDIGQELTYSILSGNTNEAFAINENTGLLTVNNASVLNYESNPEFGLTVKVQDNGPELLSTEALIAITLIDVNEVPIIENQTFSLLEMGNFTIQVGTVEADDPDFNQVLTYSILPGLNDVESVFEINAVNGIISVINIAELDHDTNPVYHLNIQVQDNGEGELTNQALITINILDVNEPPEISDQEFSININLENDINNGEIYIGTIIAYEPEDEQTISFSIEDGNDRNIFSLLDNTGKLIISNPSALYMLEYYNYSLQIKVEDDSPQHLYAIATVDIHVYSETGSNDEKSSELLGLSNIEENQFSMNLYPNPTSNFFEIDMKNLESGRTTVTVFSTTGEIIIQESYISENDNMLKKFDIENYRSGLYFIKVSNNSTIYNSKIVKE